MTCFRRTSSRRAKPPVASSDRTDVFSFVSFDVTKNAEALTYRRSKHPKVRVGMQLYPRRRGYRRPILSRLMFRRTIRCGPADRGGVKQVNGIARVRRAF